MNFYPVTLSFKTHVVLDDNVTLIIRSLWRTDEFMMNQLFASLSGKTIAFRLFQAANFYPNLVVERLLGNEGEDNFSIGAFINTAKEEEKLVGVGYCTQTTKEGIAEVSILVGDAWLGKKISLNLLKAITNIIYDQGINEIESFVHKNYKGMLPLFKAVGTDVSINKLPNVYHVTYRPNCNSLYGQL